jgi:nicotinate-nucleotide adenylyltransferase
MGRTLVNVMKRIGIYGGSFNPFHLGHLFVGCAAAEAFALDKVLLVPCAVSPFKIGEVSELASGEDRLAMIRESVAGNPLFEPCDIELARGGVSYAVDTVAALRERYAGAKLYFIIGMDSLPGLSKWYDAGRLVSLCDIITVARPGSVCPPAESLGFPAATARHLLGNVIQGRLCDISSSEIRRRIAESRPIRYLVPLPVEKLIRERGLYRRPAGK